MDSPIIGILGSRDPRPPYKEKMGHNIGYALREYIYNSGCLFTGGVWGVGEDIYHGIVNYCVDNVLTDDKFFVLLPNKFKPTEGYYINAARLPRKHKFSFKQKPKIVERGHNMSDRQHVMGVMGELLVVVSGEYGTLKESMNAIRLERKVIVLPYTGGIAKALAKAKENGPDKSLSQMLEELNFHQSRITELYNNNQITVTDSIDEMLSNM